ncbi:MAG TPA: lamin tail domain-containing protein, partial [Thermoanaerobaculia bacterium]|nr:lamin tail domain-containing protein [Thermoanaerobaculia bacterium]
MKLRLAVVLATCMAIVPSVFAVSSTIVISQVYGGGGNTSAPYQNDFIELYNRGTTTVNVTGWTVQYASASGTSWTNSTTLSGSIAPGHYFLVKEAAGNSCSGLPCGIALPAAEATGAIAMSASAGKVALVNNGTALSGNGCPFAAGVVDFVGYGGANCSEGTPTPTLTNTTAASRINNGCTDTDNNSADFSVAAPNPRNSSSTNTCGNNPPTITPPANPIKTVDQDAPPFTVNLTGNDDG